VNILQFSKYLFTKISQQQNKISNIVSIVLNYKYDGVSNTHYDFKLLTVQ